MDENDNNKKEIIQESDYINLSFEIPFKKIFVILITITVVLFVAVHLYFFCLDNICNCSQNFINKVSSSGDEVKLANITGNEREDIVVLKTPVKTILNSTLTNQQDLLIYSYNKKEHAWKQEYETGFFPEFSVKMNIEPNLIDGRDAVVIYRQEGSGAFLTYYIIGKSFNNRIHEIMSNEYSGAIYQGSYKIINNKFVTYSNNIKQDEYCYNNAYGMFNKCTE